MNNAHTTLFNFFGAINFSAASQHGAEAAEQLLQPIRAQVPGLGREYLQEVIAKLSDELLKIEVVDILVATWKKNEELAEYLDQKKHPPDQVNLVPLFDHTIESEHEPSIEIRLGETPLQNLQFTVVLELELEGVLLKIQDRKIKEIKLGACKGKGEIKYKETTLVEKETQSVNLPSLIVFHEGELLGENVSEKIVTSAALTEDASPLANQIAPTR